MRRRRATAVIVSGIVILSLSQSALADEPVRVRKPTFNGQTYVPGELLVKFRNGTSASMISTALARTRASQLSTRRTADFLRVRIPQEATVEAIVEQLTRDPSVEYAEPNFIAYAFWVPNDEFYRRQWHLDNPQYGGIHMEGAWNVEDGDPDVTIAVVDTGVAYEDYTDATKQYSMAPDLAQTRFVPGYDFVNEDTHPNDDEGHGTHVTGTIAQSTNNGIGTAGVAFNCSIMPVKVLNSSGSGTYADVADGIRFAADHGAKVINMSLGGPSASTTLLNALAYAYGKGVTLVCAAGNNGSTTLGYPAAYDAYCLAIGATRYDETLAYYSNHGASLDLVAPGGDLNVDQNGDGYFDGVLQQTFGSTLNDWGYWLYQGTSMATPHVSGVAGLVIARGIASIPSEVRTVLQSTAEDKGAPGWDSTYGYGIVNAQAALAYVPPIANQPPTAAPGGPYNGTEDLPVSFDGSGSSDPEEAALTYAWNFGDSTTGIGAAPTHTYATGGAYTVTLVVNDGANNSAPATTTAAITEVNDVPVADAGADQSAVVGQTVNFNGSGSFDPDGSIASYAWDFGDGSSATGVTTSHVYTASGPATVTLRVTDKTGAPASDTALVTVSNVLPPVEVFSDSFEVSEWNGLWTEDSQNDWRRSSQRAVNGGFSAEVDGSAFDAKLISKSIDLQGRKNATITFSWYIENSLDPGEYLAFDVSTNGGTSWVENARLRGNVDPEEVWRAAQIEVSNITSLRIRFRGKMSSSTEDADVDQVTVVAH